MFFKITIYLLLLSFNQVRIEKDIKILHILLQSKFFKGF